MAIQPRLEPGSTGTIQPQPGTSPVDIAAEQALAGAQIRSAQATQEVAGQVQTVATQIMRDETLKAAQRDAAQVVTVEDVEGKRGWGGFLYNEAYTKGAVAQYSSLAVTDAQAKAQEVLSRNPNNPDAVRREMTEYLDAKKKAMPEHVADAMTPHYTGILSGAVSSATAGAGRVNLASLEQTSKAQLNGYILNYANALSSARYSNSSPTAQADTESAFEGKWKLIEDQMLTYMTPQAVAQVKTDARALISANVKGAEFEKRAQGMMRDPVGIAKLKLEADQWAKDPSRAEHYGPTKSTLDGYIDRGAQMAGAVEQAVLIDQHLKVGTIQDQVAQLDANQKDPTKKLDVKEYEAQRTAILNQAVQAGVGRLPGQKAQLIAAAGSSDSTVQQMYGSAMLQATGRAQYGATREVQLQGREEVRGMMQDEHFLRMAGNNLYVGSLYQQGQKLLAVADMETKAVDVIQLGAALQSKDLSPQNLPQVYTNAVNAGLVGDKQGQMPIGDFYTKAQVGLGKNKEFSDAQAQSLQALKDTAGSDTSYGRPATEAEIKAHQTVRPDQFFGKDDAGRDKAMPFNPNVPAHLAQGVATVVRANYLPEAIKNWGANLSPSSSPEDQTKAVGVYDQVRQVWAQKYASLPAEIREGKIYEATKATVGDGFTKNVTAFRRAPGDANKIAELIKQENAARNAPPGELTSYGGALVGAVSREFDKGSPSLFTGAAMGAAKYIAGLNPTAQRGVEWLQSMKMFQNAGLAALTSSLPQFGRDPGMGTPKEGNIRIDPTALAVLDAQATGPTGYMTLHGNTWRDQGLNPHQQSLYRSLQDHPEMFSMVWSRDNQGDHHAVLTYRDYRSEYNQLHRQPGINPWTDGEIRDSDIAILSVRHPYHMGQANVDTGVYRTLTQPDGQTSWQISFQNKDLSKPPISFPVRPDDPLHDTLRQDMARNLAQRTEMPSLYDFIRSVPGVALADSMVAQGRQAAMLQAASGRNGPGENWTALIDSVRAGFEVFTDQQIKAGNTNVQTIKPADWAKLRRPEMQATINEMGSLYALLFGSQPQLPVLGRGGSLEPGPPEPVVPGPTSTGPAGGSLELQQRALESRQQASPQTRRLIENSFRPPGSPPRQMPLGPDQPPPPAPAAPTSLPLVPPAVPPKR